MSDSLTFKWGTLKGWSLESEKARAALERWFEGGVSYSLMAQRDTADQKQALCDLIDSVEGDIFNDWSGKNMTKEEAKRYVMEYRA